MLRVEIARSSLHEWQKAKVREESPTVLTLPEALQPAFARFVLKFYEDRLLNLARGANTEGLTLPIRRTSRADSAPSEQEHFAELATRHERLRAVQREALRQAEHLFASVLDRAFSSQ
jgi:hypothetical protein